MNIQGHEQVYRNKRNRKTFKPVFCGGKNYGIEVKFAGALRITKSIRAVMADLNLEKLFIIYPGKESYNLSNDILVLPPEDLENVSEL